MGTMHYMKVSGIPGESTSSTHKDWIELLNFSHSVTAPDEHGRPANYMDFSVNKYVDRASPLLALACSEGWRLEEIQIESVGENDRIVMEMKLTGALIMSYNLSACGDPSHPAYDSLCLRYAKLEWRYFTPGVEKAVVCTWSSEETSGVARGR
jgi:type VI secretion system secreted protein Hcp